MASSDSTPGPRPVFVAIALASLSFALACGVDGAGDSASPGGTGDPDAAPESGAPSGGGGSSADGGAGSRSDARAGGEAGLDGSGVPPSGPPPSGPSDDEFVGPFPSWANLKNDYGAKGDGTTDDTAAIQKALNDLGTAGHSPILFVPAGTYIVTSTVTLLARTQVGVIGEHPDTTALKWAGPAGGTLFHIDGVAYSRFNRLTFDGGPPLSSIPDGGAPPNDPGGSPLPQAFVGVDQSAGTGQGQFFDTGNEYADDVFEHATYGIRAGAEGGGAAESSVLRCKFIQNSYAGIALKNFNALDWWIWDSTFDGNYIGITNNPGAGNFHAYRSLFKHSLYSDLDIDNTGQFNFRFNTSIGSRFFLVEEYFYTNAALTTLQGNTVIDPTSSYQAAVYQGNMGALFMYDNVFASPDGATQPAILHNSQDPPDTISIGNTYTVNDPVSSKAYTGNVPGRLITSGNKIVPRSSISSAEPTMPGVLPKYSRQVFEVPSGATAAQIQSAVQQAAALCGSRPVVHLPYGDYHLDQTITVPANCDIQIVGDGGKTNIAWYGSGSPAMFELQGPSRAILRDLLLYPSGATGIRIDDADQPGSRVYVMQGNFNRGQTANLFVDGLDYTSVELHDTCHQFTAISPATSGASVKVVGGPMAAAGTPQTATTAIFAGASGDNFLTFDVTAGARISVQDSWYEARVGTDFAHVGGNSTFSLEGSLIDLPTGSSVVFEGFTGTATLMTTFFADHPLAFGGSGNGSLWIVGNKFANGAQNFTGSQTGLTTSFTNNRWDDPGYGSRSLDNYGVTPDDAFIQATFAPARSRAPSAIGALPAGVTDVRAYRVTTDTGSYGIHITK